MGEHSKCLFGRISLCHLGWPRTHFIDQAGLKLTVISLPQPLPSAELTGVCRHIQLPEAIVKMVPPVCLVSNFQSYTYLNLVLPPSKTLSLLF